LEETEDKPKEQRPRMIILLPSKELVKQITTVTKEISHFAKIKSVSLRSDYKLSRLVKSLKEKNDVVVTTPDTLIKLREKQFIFFSDIHYIVFDEADALFSKGFKDKVIKELMEPLQVKKQIKVEFEKN
jgi:superfamily II DNA/RNA helicase